MLSVNVESYIYYAVYRCFTTLEFNLFIVEKKCLIGIGKSKIKKI